MNSWKSSFVAAAITAMSWLPATSAYAAVGQNQAVVETSVPGESALVNINTADEAELANLPGVGAKKAAAIVTYRSQVGSFTSIEELLEIKGIGPKILEKLKSKVSL